MDLETKDGRQGVVIDRRFHPVPLAWRAVENGNRTWDVIEGETATRVLTALITATKDAVLASRARLIAEWHEWATAATSVTVRPIKVPRELGDAEAERILAESVAVR